MTEVWGTVRAPRLIRYLQEKERERRGEGRREGGGGRGKGGRGRGPDHPILSHGSTGSRKALDQQEASRPLTAAVSRLPTSWHCSARTISARGTNKSSSQELSLGSGLAPARATPAQRPLQDVWPVPTAHSHAAGPESSSGRPPRCPRSWMRSAASSPDPRQTWGG